MQWNAYWRLMRLDKPIGILLLWYPTAWALWIANKGTPSLNILFLFLLGTIIMRSAGCVINDIADRNVDKHVSRTKLRPLTSGELSLKDAFLVLFTLLVLALIVLLCLPWACFSWALMALLVTFIYPFCKRYISAPQFVLGLAFSMGIPMAFVASGVDINEQIGLLLFINFCWIVAYDTMYAMVDKEDDLKIGVKSTAIYFAQYDRMIIGLLQGCMHTCWLYLGIVSNKGISFICLWLLASSVLVYQQQLINQRNPSQCFRSFLISSYYGAIMWLAVMI